MSFEFVRARPLQAGKLIAITVALLAAIGGTVSHVPGVGLDALLFVTVFGLCLAVVVTAETLIATYRALRADEPMGRRFADRSVYMAIRAGEVVVAILAASAFVVLFSRVTDGPMAGPGAIGLLFVGVGLSLLILVASLVRTLTEYYYHQGTAAA